MKKFLVLFFAVFTLCLSASFSISADEIIEETPVVEEQEEIDFGKWLQEHFTAEVITSVTSVAIMLIAILTLVKKMKDLSKEKTMTVEDVSKKVVETLELCFKGQYNEVIKPLIEKTEKINPVLEDFSKILALSQENTAESRLAILELISKMGTVEKKVVEEAKQIVVEEKQAKEEKHIEEKSQLEDIEGRY